MSALDKWFEMLDDRLVDKLSGREGEVKTWLASAPLSQLRQTLPSLANRLRDRSSDAAWDSCDEDREWLVALSAEIESLSRVLCLGLRRLGGER